MKNVRLHTDKSQPYKIVEFNFTLEGINNSILING